MEEPSVSDIFHMFDIFFALLENPNIAEQNDLQNVIKVFNCGQFIEAAVKKAFNEGKECALESHLHSHWIQKKRTVLYKCAELANACDKLLEIYMKNVAISNETISELVTLYVEHCGSERLNEFLKETLIKSISANVILDSLNNVGIDLSETEDEAILVSWEVGANNGHQDEVSACICKMFNDGHISKLIRFATKSDGNGTARKLIMNTLMSKLDSNDAQLCIALSNINKQLLFMFLESDEQLYINVLDTIFYFGRNMTAQENIWISDYEFKYHHLVRIINILLDGPKKIRKILSTRLEIMKTLANNKIWNDIATECT